MPHMQWIDPSWNYDGCSSEETETRQMEMKGILDAINKLIGFDPNSASAKAEFQAQENYSEAVTKAKLDYNRTMNKVLHNYHKARTVKGYRDVTTIEEVYNRGEARAARRCSKAEEQAFKDYNKASKLAKALQGEGLGV